MAGVSGNAVAAGAGEADGADEGDEDPWLVTGSNVRSAWVTAAAFVTVAYIEGFTPAPVLVAAGVPLGPVLHLVINTRVEESKRGLATIGAVGAFVAAVLLGFLQEAVGVALGVDLGTLALAYGERWMRD